MQPKRRKIIVLCLCFWSVVLVLASTFRVRSWQILAGNSGVIAAHDHPRAVVDQPRERPAADRNTTGRLKQWKDWRQTPSNWDQKKKEDFFAQNCRDLIESARAREKQAPASGYSH